MNKAIEKPTAAYEYPKGSHFTWTGNGPFGAAPLKTMHGPTVAVIKADAPVTFEGSLDGQHYAPLRDKEGEIVRLTKAGIYRLPVSVVWLRPISEGDVEIHTFVQARG